MDPYRLPNSVVPIRYDLRLEPDLAACCFSGEETITVEVRDCTSEIVLNATELEISRALLLNDQGVTHRCRVDLDERLERCRVTSPEPLVTGPWRLRLTFSGILNDKLRGFYRSTYKDQHGRSRTLAATQFEATDARRAFPCWDEPAFKAVFATTLVVAPELTAVSNTPIKSEHLEGGTKVVSFHDSIVMSTYLVAFVVGELESSEPVMVDRVPVRIWCVPGKQRLSAFAQSIAAFSLQFFQKYYGLAYPGDKLDLLAIPDFASGAMENLGAITFRETALLIDEQTATHAELERVADVVAHENAHMWFGDLVTMSWWNGLWLNEAFATFMEMLAVDAWKPGWDRWSTFGVSRAAALAVDGLHSTRPIEFTVRAPQDADAMFDVLTYEKGASVLRMLEQHLGPEVFRAGVRGYLQAHAYANADTQDLWAALGRAASEPVPELMHRWIFGEGYPLITVDLEDDRTASLSQQRFTYLPAPSDSGATDAPAWHVPLQLRINAGGNSESVRLLLTDTPARLPLNPDFRHLLVNEGGHGFYRVRYAATLLQRLVDTLPTGLSSIERFNLLSDAWAASLAGLMSITEYLDLTTRFCGDRDKNVWSVMIESLQCLNRLVGPDERPGLQALVQDRLRPAVADLGWAPRANEDDLMRQLRGDLIRALGTLGNDAGVQREAGEHYATYVGHPQAIDSNVLPSLVSVLAYCGDEARYDQFRARYQSASTPQEERRYLFALAAFQRPPLLERTLASALDGGVRTQDGPFVVSAVLQNVHGRSLAWEFVKQHWDDMDRLFPKQGLRRMCGGITALATPELERDVGAFFESRKIDLGGRVLAQYLEQLRVFTAFRERSLNELTQYLQQGARPSRP